MARARNLALLIGAGAALFACNAVLGLEEKKRGVDSAGSAGEAGSGETTVGGKGGASGRGTGASAGSSKAGEAGDSGQGADGGAGGATTGCDDGDLGCAGRAPLSCQDGEMLPSASDCEFDCREGVCVGACPDGLKRCVDGRFEECVDHVFGTVDDCDVCDEELGCVGACTEDALQCNGDRGLDRCTGGVYVPEATCEFVCRADACAGECLPGDADCAGLTAKNCNANGEWDETPCANACLAGRCVACDPLSERCASGATKVERCNDEGGWARLSVCQTADTFCGPCQDGDDCTTDGDCESDHCVNDVCQPPEDCENGVDDDQNGATDCMDPACTAAEYRCLSVPSGWDGPVARWDGSGSAPTCKGDYLTSAYTGSSGLNAGSASCVSCSCTHTCGLSGWVGSANCSETGNINTNLSTTTGCTSLGYPIKRYQYYRTAGNMTQDGCAPSGGSLTKATPSFDVSARLCSLTTDTPGGCQASAVCAPPATSPFDGSLCVYRSGSQACPAGFPNPTIYYAGYDDTRSCTSCACSGSSCGSLTAKAYDGYDCTGSVIFSGVVQTSFPACGETDFLSMGWEASSSCTASGGSLQGSVTPTGPVTVCCE